MSSFTAQFPYAVAVLTLFFGYGALVRRGTIAGRAILSVGALVAVLAMGIWFVATYQSLTPEARRTPLLFLGPGMMGFCAAFCVASAYRLQKVVDVATFQTGDTKVIVRSCLASRIPDADALILPTSTTLRLLGGMAGAVSVAAGAEVEREAVASAPVNIGKIVATGAGRLTVGRIFHVAVHDPLKPVDQKTLQRGMESAAQQARKADAESLAVVVGALRGLPAGRAAGVMAQGILKHRKAFGEIVFVVLEPRSAAEIALAVEEAVEAAVGNTGAADRGPDQPTR